MNGTDIKKNIGYQELTNEEYNYLKSCNNREYSDYIDVYDKISNWKKYVISRGASLHYNLSDYNETYQSILKEHSTNAKKLINDTLDKIKCLADPMHTLD